MMFIQRLQIACIAFSNAWNLSSLRHENSTSTASPESALPVVTDFSAGCRAGKPIDINCVKAVLALQGLSLREWSRINDFPVSTVSMVMHGKRTTGPVAKEIAAELRRIAA